jgi:hypothetical protein
MRRGRLPGTDTRAQGEDRREVMPLATNKLRILGKTKNPVTGEFSSNVVKAPVTQPKSKPEKKS